MTMERFTGERRTAGSIQLIALYITILVNVAVIVWGAATLSAQVSNIQRILTPMQQDVLDLKIANAIQHDRETRGKENDK